MRQPRRPAPALRSMLFVPGQKPAWMRKAIGYGADALILDLEDAVTEAGKPEARRIVAQALADLAEAPPALFVRINAWRTGHALADLLAVVGPALAGVMVPKVEDAEDVVATDMVLGELETERDLPVGSIEVFPLFETARGMYRAHAVCAASERVRRCTGGTSAVLDGDETRALGLHPRSDTAEEFLYLTSRITLEARAAGVTQIYGGMTTKVEDLELVRHLALRARAMGGTGGLAIHPTHVPILNEVYGLSSEEVAAARSLVATMREAMARGDAAARHDGAMVDVAHLRTAQETLAWARDLGFDVGDDLDPLAARVPGPPSQP